jgi:hypothetical protein
MGPGAWGAEGIQARYRHERSKARVEYIKLKDTCGKKWYEADEQVSGLRIPRRMLWAAEKTASLECIYRK